MSARRRILHSLRTTLRGRAAADVRRRAVLTAAVSLSFNLAYAFYHGALGIIGRSRWFTASCAYYILLAMTRFCAVLCERKNSSQPSPEMEYFVMKVSGALLLPLSGALAAVSYISLTERIAVRRGEIVMITIAAYTFGRITMAVVRLVRQKRAPTPLLAVIRRIGYADAAVSVLTLQRSMLVSFGSMAADRVYRMNALTGGGVCLFISILGITMIAESRGKTYGKIKACESK